MRTIRRIHRGFTKVEFIIVLAMIAVVGGLGFVVFLILRILWKLGS